MKRSRLLPCLLVLVTSPSAEAAAQQRRVSAEPWFERALMLSAEIGGTAFSDFQRGLARPAPGSDLDGGELGDFRRRVSAHTTATMGASATWWVRGGWGLRVGAAYSPTRFTVWNEEAAARVLEAHADEQPTYARLHSWSVDASAAFRFPFVVGRVVPYGRVGGGLAGWRLADDAQLPPEAERSFAGGSRRGPAAVFGVGSAIPLQRYNLLLNFELTNHLSRTPLNETAAGSRFHIGDVPLDLDSNPERGTDAVGSTNQFRLTVGITLPIRL
jgi:hypothetical protein